MSTELPVWFITGCSSGFGFALSLLVLKSGHRVIATCRNPEKNTDAVSQVESLGGVWLALDVCTSEPELATIVEKATSIYGRIDVLVNSAGYSILGAFECISDAECRAQFETNFFGPVTLTRLILPSMRARRSGTIINISSTAGIEAKPSRTMYSGSKFALEAFSEALYHEMKPFNVRVLVVEPGAFDTNMGSGASLVFPAKPLPVVYEGTITGQNLNMMKNPPQGYRAPGDVNKAAKAIFEVATRTGQAASMPEFVRLPLGNDGSARWEIKLADLRRNLDGTENIWSSTDADKTTA